MKHGVTDMLKVILFDVDNTILSFDEYVKESMKNGFEKFEIGTYKEEMFSDFKFFKSIFHGFFNIFVKT